MAVFLALVVLAVFLVWYLVQERYGFWRRRGFPYLEPTFPWGNLNRFFRGKQYLGHATQEVYNRMKDNKYCGIFHILKPVLVVKDKDEIQNFLTKEFGHFPSRDENLDRDLEFMSQNIFHMQDKDQWKVLRSRLSKAFSTNRLRIIYEQMLRCSEKLLEGIDESVESGRSLEMKYVSTDYITDVVFFCFFGITVKKEWLKQNSELRRIQDAMAFPELITQIRMLLYNIASWLPRVLKVRLMPKYVTSFFTQLTLDLIQFRETNHLSRKDVFDELLQMKNSTDALDSSRPEQQTSDNEPTFRMDLDTMAAQCFLLYAAAFDPVSYAICTTLSALASHPEVQSKVQSEVDQILVKHGGTLTYDALHEMEYLCQVVSESLRLNPPIPEVARKCVEDYRTQDGLLVERGVRVVVPIFAIHRDPRLYPDPAVFDPERFRGQSLKARPTYPFMPFGDGPRSCLGMRFGILQVRFTVAQLMRRYKVELDPRSSFPIKFSPKIFVVSVSEDGFWMKFTKREHK